jgi:hypothetical protein
MKKSYRKFLHAAASAFAAGAFFAAVAVPQMSARPASPQASSASPRPTASALTGTPTTAPATATEGYLVIGNNTEETYASLTSQGWNQRFSTLSFIGAWPESNRWSDISAILRIDLDRTVDGANGISQHFFLVDGFAGSIRFSANKTLTIQNSWWTENPKAGANYSIGGWLTTAYGSDFAFIGAGSEGGTLVFKNNRMSTTTSGFLLYGEGETAFTTASSKAFGGAVGIGGISAFSADETTLSSPSLYIGLLDNVSFTGNSVTATESAGVAPASNIYAESIAGGGALAVRGELVFENINTLSFSSNTATGATSGATAFSSAYGGAIYASCKEIRTLKFTGIGNLQFTDNTAIAQGSNNWTSAFGGAIHAEPFIDILFDTGGNITFSGNRAEGVRFANGGAISYSDSSLDLYIASGKTVTFSGNIAKLGANEYSESISLSSTSSEENERTWFYLVNNGTLDMRDPIYGESGSEDDEYYYPGDLWVLQSNASTGVWKLGGDNFIYGNDIASSWWIIDGGTLHLYRENEVAGVKAATITLAGDSYFSVGGKQTIATLSVGGGGGNEIEASEIHFEDTGRILIDLSHATPGVPLLSLYGDSFTGTQIGSVTGTSVSTIGVNVSVKNFLTAQSGTYTLVDVSGIPGATVGTSVGLSTNSISSDGPAFSSSASRSADGTKLFFTITVNGITQQPAAQTVWQGASATFSVTANSSGALTYQWYFNGKIIKGATDATYTIAKTTAKNKGTYSVVVNDSQNGKRWTSTAAALDVNVPVKPKITTKPIAKVETRLGGEFSLTVAATGNPPPTFQWLRDGVAIPASENASAATATLTISNVTDADLRKYTVVVTSGPNKVTSSASTVSAVLPPVVETPSPESPEVLTYALATKGAKLSIKLAKNKAKPTYLWLLNDSPAPGANNKATYTAKQDGKYSVRVYNGAAPEGVEKVIAYVKLITPPKIAALVADVATVAPGGSVTLTVSIQAGTGTEPLTYQWLLDGKPAPGAQNLPTYTATALQKNAKFSVTVTNGSGKVVGKAKSKTVTVKVQ